MSEFTEEPYTVKHMKRRLEEHFGDNIFITESTGEQSFITLKKKASDILWDFHRTFQNLDEESAKITIIKTAASLMKTDIKNLSANKDLYPDFDDVSCQNSNLNFLPLSLKMFLEDLFVGTNSQLKVASIGQSIVQATRPRVMLCPLQLSLGVQMHHQFGSKSLVETLFRLGFSCSYSEVKTFEGSAALYQKDKLLQCGEHSFVQFAADNVDHNLRTLDGLETFHGMGSIAIVTPAAKMHIRIPRRHATAKEIAEVGKIIIHRHKLPDLKKGKRYFEAIEHLEIKDPTKELDILWKTSQLLRPSRPLWSGFMQSTHSDGQDRSKGSITFLPLIDMDPNDASCIFSTLYFIAEQCKGNNIVPVVTFDQPLYSKALSIIDEESPNSLIKNTVVRLGGFHMLMSFMGSIGYIMDGSGIQEALKLVYASNTIPHIMSGKAFARALRAHIMIDSALHAVVLRKVFDLEQREEPSADGNTGNDVQMDSLDCCKELQDIVLLFDSALSGSTGHHELAGNQDCSSIVTKINEEKMVAKQEDNLTSQLWFTYMEMVDVLFRFIKAERTGNWKLHLSSVREMLPFFAASGHSSYLKSSSLYLSSMLKLQETSPLVYDAFISGKHTARRSDRYWAGLSIDLCIEQVLMRSIKRIGGLTHGRGMAESERALWVLSMPACTALTEAFSTLTFEKGKQDIHVDLTAARKATDAKDVGALFNFFLERNPFETGNKLRDIATGIAAADNVNVHRANEIGETILTAMAGQRVADYSFKHSLKAVNFAQRQKVSLEGDSIIVDPSLLFQRLIILAEGEMSSIEDALTYELTSYPASLFEAPYIPRPAYKAGLSEGLLKMFDKEVITREELPEVPASFVLDGGSLLQRIPWPRGSTYIDIISIYREHVKRRYGRATVVFDGYPQYPTTKDITHIRRKTGCARSVSFTEDMIIPMKKDIFLSNAENKQKFILMLGSKLSEDGHTVLHAQEDADVLIVKTATIMATSGPTVVIGEDTDLLVLLCFHASANSVLYFKSEMKAQKIWDIPNLRHVLGEKYKHLPFVHAILGCDTTSRIFGLGKSASLKKLNDSEFLEICKVFSSKADKEIVIKAGERALLILLGFGHFKTLNEARVKQLRDKSATAKRFVEPQSLAPTSAAAKYHSLRVFHQLQLWIDDSALPPTDFGWQIIDGKIVAVMTDLQPAPQLLLKVVRCSCKGNCQNFRCSCKKHGLSCTSVCSHCHGSCYNITKETPEEVEMEYEEN